MTENEIAKIAVDCAFKVHSTLGPGLLEHIYEVALQHELKKRGLVAERQVAFTIVYDGIQFDEGLRMDMLVEGKVIVEIKSVKEIHPKHKMAVLSYLRLTDKRLALLINFDVQYIKDGITRLVNRLPETDTPSEQKLYFFRCLLCALYPLASLRAKKVRGAVYEAAGPTISSSRARI